MNEHSTTWEDSGSAGFYCYNTDTQVAGEMQTIDSERGVVCKDCYQKLKLVWDVKLEVDDE